MLPSWKNAEQCHQQEPGVCFLSKHHHQFCGKEHPKNDPQEKQMKALLNKERATRLEGSFGV